MEAMLRLLCSFALLVCTRTQLFSLDAQVLLSTGQEASLQLAGDHHVDCSEPLKIFCVDPNDCKNTCGEKCGIGMAPNGDEPASFICDVQCSGGLFADHTNHVCAASCPLGAVQKSRDSSGAGEYDLFDCKKCGFEDPDETVHLYADRPGKACVVQCPAGAVQSVVNETYECSYCDDAMYADHEAELCLTNGPADECPPGSAAHDESNDCKAKCPPEDEADQHKTSWDIAADACVDECQPGLVPMTWYHVCTACNHDEFADHDAKKCQSVESDCPAGSTADAGTNDCQHSCPPNITGAPITQRNATSWDSSANQCVQLCPSGAITTTKYKKCTFCGRGTYAEHITNECVKHCPPGSVSGQPVHWDLSVIECHECGVSTQVGKPYAFRDPVNMTCVSECPPAAPYRHLMDCMDQCPSGMAPKACVHLDQCPLVGQGALVRPLGDKGGKVECENCPNSTWADHNSHICVEICPNVTLSYKTPKDCVARCPTSHIPKGGKFGRDIADVPEGEDYQECIRCEEGLWADRELEICVEDCPKGTTKNDATKECIKDPEPESDDAEEEAPTLVILEQLQFEE